MKIFKICFLLLTVYCIFGFDIAFDDVNTLQRRDGTQLWDIYFYTTDIDPVDSLRCMLTPTLSTGETLVCETFVSPSDTGYIFESGYKHIIWNYGEDNPSREIFSDGIIFEVVLAPETFIPGSCSPFIYIADSYNHRIVRIDNIEGENWISFGSRGRNTGEFNGPFGISVSDSGRIYIADYENNRIVKMDNMAGDGWEIYSHFGSGVGEFYHPIDLEITNDYLYVIDYGNSRIVRMDDISGTNWVSFGSSGAGYGHFDHPAGIAVDDYGRIYIADDYNNRIVRMNNIFGDGWVSLGAAGHGEGTFTNPCDIAVLENEKIYITERGTNRIIRVDNMSGDGWYEVSDSMGLGADFGRVSGIAGSTRKGVFVLDQEGRRVVKLDYRSLSFEGDYGSSGSGTGHFNLPRSIDVKW